MEESEMIDGYLKGELEGESLTDMESRINADPSFKARVELRRLLIDSIHRAHEDELKNKLKAFDQKIDQRPGLIKSPYMIAASLAVIVAICGVYLYRISGKSKFEKYDIYEMGIPNAMGPSENLQFTAAMNHFKAEQYPEALQVFQGITQSDTVLYYSGISAYRIGKLDKAVQCFQAIPQGSEYFTKSNYRLGLVYWRENQIDLAIEILVKVTQDTSSEYGKNAKEILSKEF